MCKQNFAEIVGRNVSKAPVRRCTLAGQYYQASRDMRRVEAFQNGGRRKDRILEISCWGQSLRTRIECRVILEGNIRGRPVTVNKDRVSIPVSDSEGTQASLVGGAHVIASHDSGVFVKFGSFRSVTVRGRRSAWWDGRMSTCHVTVESSTSSDRLAVSGQ